MGEVVEGGDVLLYLDARRKYLVKVKDGVDLHTHKGFIKLKELIGKRFGDRVKSSMGIEFIALKPTIKDYISKFTRMTQVLYPKDIALIIIYTGIGPGSKVVEGGVGSGAMTSVLAHYVRPNGKVYGYEIREEFLKNARRNIEKAGLINYVELKNKDVIKGIDESDVDAVVLDIPTPWLAAPQAYRCLKGGGMLASFSPTINQVEKAVEAFEGEGFIDIEALECLVRTFKVKSGETRPNTIMVGHTGYIVFARKAFKTS